MLKKIIALALAMVLTATVSVAGTVAYLQDDVSDVNVMTVGRVKIEQIEQERDENGNLVDFTQAKPLYPAYYDGDSIPWNDAANWPVANDEAWKVVAENENVVDKFVTVKNIGWSDAYVRTIIAFEGDAISGTDIHINHNGGNNTGVEWKSVENVTINGVRYDVIVYTYPAPLKPGATSIPSLKQVYMDKNSGNEDVERFGATYDILVLSQAVQTKGFADAYTALDEAFGEISTDNLQTWFKDLGTPVLAANAEDLGNALKNGGNSILTKNVEVKSGELLVSAGSILDGGNNEIKCFSGISTKPVLGTTGGTIKNVTVNGGGKSVQGIGAGMTTDNPLTEDLYLDKVTVDDVMYAVIGTASDVNVYVTNSTLYGAFSYPGAKMIEISNTTLGAGKSMYDFFEVAGDTAFVDCTFKDSYCILAYAEAAGKTVTFDNCYVNGEKLTAENFKTLLVDDRWDYSSDLCSTNLKNCTIEIDGVAVIW